MIKNWKSFNESFEPIESEVIEIENILSNLYDIKWYDILGKKTKGIYIDDKVYYISSSFTAKKRIVNKIYLEVMDDLKEYKESSIRKAIKNFLNR
jgi:hypothetical protein